MSDASIDTRDEKTSARRPEGPRHAHEGSMVQTLKRTVTEFSEDRLTDASDVREWVACLVRPTTEHLAERLIKRRRSGPPGRRGGSSAGPC